MIYYFSGTGNSKYISDKIANALNIKSISLNEYIKNNLNILNNENDDYLGFVFPTYDYDIPYVIKEYLNNAKIENIKNDIFVFGVFTCGEKTGSSYISLKDVLNKRGLKINLAYSVKMVDNSIPWFKPESEEIKIKLLNEADKKLKIIIDNIKNKKEIINCDKKANFIMKFIIDKFLIPSQKSTKHFYVNDNCIGCGLCEKICPMNCIKIIDKRPKWNNNICSCCLGCVHRCPVMAIQYNKKTEKRSRYYNPNVK